MSDGALRLVVVSAGLSVPSSTRLRQSGREVDLKAVELRYLAR
ncbi:hypothetical protein OHV05_05815 [Kitasatospora sp. NBC_00070]